MTKLKLPFELSEYQKAWLEMMNGDSRWTLILAARGAAKTWTVALWTILRLFNGRNQVSIVPGGKQEQGSQIMMYIEEIFDANPKLLKFVKWMSATRLALKNGSVMRILAPTKAGVQGARGDIVVEEAELLVDDIGRKMEPIASKKGNRIICIGTPEFPSWFANVWESHENKSVVTWEKAVEAGILDLSAVEDYKRCNPHDDFLSQYCCQWVRKEQYVFEPLDWDGKGVIVDECVGVDCNLYPGLVWVKVAKIVDNGEYKVVAIDEGVVSPETPEEFKRFTCRVVVESNGFNTGFAYEMREYADGHYWTDKEKSANVQMGKILNDRRMVYIGNAKKCGISLRNTRFFPDGKIDKNSDTHYTDAWLHAIWGLN